MADKAERIDAAALERFVLRALRAVKVRADVGRDVAAALVGASLRGVDSHGVRLLPHYLGAVEHGRINPDPAFRFRRTRPGAGILDADHSFGHAAGVVAMRQAMRLARACGVGAVSVCNSTHCGAMAHYTLAAAEKGFIGLAFTHADSLVNSFGSSRALLGTNPIAVAVPCAGEEPFCFDAATSLITWNKLLQLRRRGQSLPPGCGLDERGRPTDDPVRATQLLPIGGYKGFGLGLIVDILCGVLSGMPTGRDIPSMYKTPLSQKRFLGQYYMAVDIAAFRPLPAFRRDMKRFMSRIRREPRRDPKVPVLVAGDPEKAMSAERSRRGIPLQGPELEDFKALAARYRIPFPAPRRPA